MVAAPTKRQREITDFIAERIRSGGGSPTEREIGERFGFKSPFAARSHLAAMEKKGIIQREPGKARSIRLTAGVSDGIPILGEIPAGAPMTAFEQMDEVLAVPKGLFSGAELFGLRVKGESMINKGIFSGDIAVLNRQPDVQNGEIAAVLLDDDATLKIFLRLRGKVILRAANPDVPDRFVEKDDHKAVLILGRFVGLIRRVGGRF